MRNMESLDKARITNPRQQWGSISPKFRDGGTVEELTKGLKNGTIDPNSIPPIRIVEKDGMIFTLDNRRLKAFQDAGVDIPFEKLDKIPDNEMFKFDDYIKGKTDGTTIIIRGN